MAQVLEAKVTVTPELRRYLRRRLLACQMQIVVLRGLRFALNATGSFAMSVFVLVMMTLAMGGGVVVALPGSAAVFGDVSRIEQALHERQNPEASGLRDEDGGSR